jgi:hypothetical protein
VGYGKEACACKRVPLVCACLRIAAFAQITAADGTHGAVCMVKPQAAVRSSRSGHFFHTHAHREAQRGTARHNKGMSRADENHRECIQGRGGGPAGPVPLPGQCQCHALPHALPRTTKWPTPLLGLACTHAAWHWRGSGIPSRSVASSALHALTACFIGSCHSSAFSIFFLVLQHVTGPATLVSSGVCSPSLSVLRVPNCEYSEYLTRCAGTAAAADGRGGE